MTVSYCIPQNNHIVMSQPMPVRITLVDRANSKGALHGGPPMSYVDFKKWQCRMS